MSTPADPGYYDRARHYCTDYELCPGCRLCEGCCVCTLYTQTARGMAEDLASMVATNAALLSKRKD